MNKRLIIYLAIAAVIGIPFGIFVPVSTDWAQTLATSMLLLWAVLHTMRHEHDKEHSCKPCDRPHWHQITPEEEAEDNKWYE